MAKAKSEYEVEDLLLEKLGQLGYKFVELKNYDKLLDNFREQITVFKEANKLCLKNLLQQVC